MKKVLSLVIVILVLMSSLVSCYIPIREANTEDMYREWEYEKEDNILILRLQVNEKIKDLVLQISLETEDGKVVKTFTLDVGRVVPGNQYTYRLDVSDIPVEDLKVVTKFRTRIVDGYVVIP